jgi:hypothetical protein
MAPRTIGYIIAGILLAPITFWAKQSETGMAVLVGVFLFFLVFAIVVRLKTGFWPGDTPAERGF